MFPVKPIAGILALLLTLIYVPTEAKTNVKEDKRYTEQQEVIGTYTHGKYTQNVVSIAKWQKDIMDKNKVPFNTQLLLRTIQTVECGDENGFCANRFDVGPFQINNIHVEEYKYSLNLVNKGIEEVEKAKKSKKWAEVIKIRNELYEYQMKWTWERMKSQVSRFKLPEDREQRVYKLAKLHNGSKHKESYATKALKSYKILAKYYK